MAPPSVRAGVPEPFRESGVPVRETLREAAGVKLSGRSFQCSFITPVWWDWALEVEVLRVGRGGRPCGDGDRWLIAGELKPVFRFTRRLS